MCPVYAKLMFSKKRRTCAAPRQKNIPFHRVFDELVSAKKNQDFLIFSSRVICKTKKPFKHFYYGETKHYHVVYSFENGKSDENKSIEICLYSFCRAFHGASSKRRIKILSFSQVEIYAKY